MVGTLVEGRFEQIVFDERLSAAAGHKGLRLIPFRQSGEELISQAEQEGRLLCAYSTHEQNMLKEHLGLDVADRTVNVRKLARGWHRRTWPDQPLPDWGLKTFLDFIGYPRPAHLGEQKTTHRLRGVLAGLERRGSYEALTPVQKAKWTRLLDHNRHDCLGMKALLDRVLEGPGTGG
jgi:hypothetical protein